MKILVVSPFLPTPPRFGGQRRIDGLLRELSRRHEVSILSFGSTDEWAVESVRQTSEYCVEVRTIDNFEPRQESVKRRLQLRSLVSRHSYEHQLATSRLDFSDALEEMTAATRFDLVQIEFAQLAPLVLRKPLPGAPLLVLDEHNIEFDLLRRTAESSSGIARKTYNFMDWRKLAREERWSWRQVDGVAVTSARDEAMIRVEQPDVRTAVVPNGVDLQQFAVGSQPPNPDVVLFFGAINYFPNTVGVLHFIDDVLPRLRLLHPSVRFRVVGPGAPAEVMDRRSEAVEIVGSVADVNPHIEDAAVVVVPLRIGGGTRLKIVEALAKGKPVVSTGVGAEGLDVVDGEHLLLADTAEQFAARIAQVLDDPELALRLGRAGRRLVEDRYGWPAIVGQLELFYAELAGARASDAVG